MSSCFDLLVDVGARAASCNRLLKAATTVGRGSVTGHREISSSWIPIVRRFGGGIFRGFICHSSHRWTEFPLSEMEENKEGREKKEEKSKEVGRRMVEGN